MENRDYPYNTENDTTTDPGLENQEGPTSGIENLTKNEKEVLEIQAFLKTAKHAEEGDPHAPDPSSSTRTFEMNQHSEEARDVFLNAPSFFETIIHPNPAIFENLPTLGPYLSKEDSSTHIGQYKDGKRHGKGYTVYLDGSIYFGYFFEGFKQGPGKEAQADGACYEGSFLAGQREGEGVISYSVGIRSYLGGFSKGLFEGFGTFRWCDGRKYVGSYKQDKKDGFGVFSWGDGRKYIGNWENGRQHGEGTFVSANQAMRRGVWQEGRRVKWIEF